MVAVLGISVWNKGESHDCRKKAEATMKLVLAKLQYGIDDTIDVIGVRGVNPAELFLHKIPIEISDQELINVFPRDLNFDMQAAFKIRGNFYSRSAIFKNACEANEAFQSIQGYTKKDSLGRLRKLVKLKLGTGQIVSFYLCKMTNPEDGTSAHQDVSSHDGDIDNLDLKRQRTATLPTTKAVVGQDDKVVRSHLLGTSKNNIQDLNSLGASSSKSCQYAEEIVRLKQVLNARIDELSKLQELLADAAAKEQ